MYKNFFVISISFLLASCGTLKTNGYTSLTQSTLYHKVDAMEILGIKGKKFENRVFQIIATGDSYSKARVKNNALWAAGKAAYDFGYEEFSILKDNYSSVNQTWQANPIMVGTAAIPIYGNSVIHDVELYILLIKEEDYPEVNNIYKAKKYYTPNSTP